MKAYKVELLIIDIDEVGEADIEYLLKSARYPNRCINPIVMDIKGKDIGEWDDNHPLNIHKTMKTEYDKLFDGE
jgi:hypothetical protein